MTASRLLFTYDAASMGTLTVEAGMNGAPLCVLRADGSEVDLANFKRAITHLPGMQARYVAALADALAAASGSGKGAT